MFGGRIRGFFRDDAYRTQPAERGLERLCQVAVLLISIGFALAAFWEIADTFSAGHFASASAVCTSAENMWQWGILAPVPHHTSHVPAPSEYYCHHPWGIFWISALFMKVLGHHAWACRLPAALQSSLTAPLLYLVGRALWGPVAGAVAAASFAVLPIALSFSDFNSLEVPVMFGTLLAIWGYARFRDSYRRRFLCIGVAGLGYAACSDWAALIFAGAMLGAMFLSVFLLKRWTPPADRRRLAVFWGASVGLCALVTGGHLYAFQHFGQLKEFFQSGDLRSNGSDLPLAQVLAARKFWIEVSFTGLAIAIGKFALPVLALRVAWRRSDLEFLPLAVFAMAVVQYVVFKQGADIHIFWPHYFAEYFALASAALTQTLLDLARRIARKVVPKLAGVWPGYACLAVGLLVPLSIVPDGLRALTYAHRSGGRFNENGHPIKPDKDKVAALEWLSASLPQQAEMALHAGMRQSLWVDWSVRRPVSTINHFPATFTNAQMYVADMRFMSAAEQDALQQSFSITAVGSFLAVDRTQAKGQLRAFSIAREEPTGLARYLVSSSHAQRLVSPDPYLTWELRDRFGLSPNEPPSSEPQTFEQMRVAHNIATLQGNTAAETRWLSTLLSGCDRSHLAAFGSGNELLGTRLERGASLVFTLYVQAAGADPSEPELALRSVVIAAPSASLVPKDDTVAEVGMPFAIPASRWKRGYVYASTTEIVRRIGRERWYGTFTGPGGRPSPIELLRLE